jgi:hypothetical protein
VDQKFSTSIQKSETSTYEMKDYTQLPSQQLNIECHSMRIEIGGSRRETIHKLVSNELTAKQVEFERIIHALRHKDHDGVGRLAAVDALHDFKIEAADMEHKAIIEELNASLRNEDLELEKLKNNIETDHQRNTAAIQDFVKKTERQRATKDTPATELKREQELELQLQQAHKERLGVKASLDKES